MKNQLPSDIVEFIEECTQQEHSDSYLIAILHRIQNQIGWLSVDHMNEVAQRLQVP
ncbi:MAG: NAD(P)H-dependent oxidoreductase subunit E, partial [Planctomycetes bacterium]|nr:NAD(P)H-dependent oxidoreductase subunit E [Planctomycetota bacterium]